MGTKKPDEFTHLPERFGEIAVRLGFCTPKDRDQALIEQERIDQAGKSHMLLGLVMLKMATIDNAQLIAVLKHYEDRESEASEL